MKSCTPQFTIGVAIATYNGQRYIKEQLQSIENQTRPPDIVVISDDRSSDETVGLINEFKRKSRLRIVMIENSARSGVINNFRTAFGSCNTDFIAYCDQDDVWHPKKLEVCELILARGGVSLVFHRSQIVDDHLVPVGRFEPFNVKQGIYKFPHYPDSLWGFGHQMVFSRQALAALESFYGARSHAVREFGQGFDFAIPLAAGMTGNIAFVGEELIKFRRHGASCSPAGKVPPKPKIQSLSKDRIESYQIELDRIKELISELRQGSILIQSGHPNFNAYLKNLERLRLIYERRIEMYTERSLPRRILKAMRLALTLPYGSVICNKLPLRILLLDTLVVSGLIKQ